MAVGCSCNPDGFSFNNMMCNADWVSHVKVLSNTTTSSHINYTVNHLEVFKSPNGTQLVGKNTSVLTAAQGSACGVWLGEKDYLIAGFGREDSLHINACLDVPTQNGKPNVESGKVREEVKKRLEAWNAEGSPIDCTNSPIAAACPSKMLRQPQSSTITRILLLFLLQIRPFALLLVRTLNDVKVGPPNRTLIVLAAPSIWDLNYADDFVPIVEFQVKFVRLLNEYESAVLIADRHTIPYLNGRNKLLREHLPAEHLLEANIYDINLHDFAPLGTVGRVKFVYRNENWASMASKQVDDSINRFLIHNRIRGHRRETDIVLVGKDVVDNGVNRALLSNITFAKNAGRVSKQSLVMKVQSAFGKVTVVPAPTPFMGRHRLRLDDVLSFIDDGVLIMSPLNPQIANKVHMEMFKREKKGVTLVELPTVDGARERQLPSDPYLSDEGNCGLYSALLATDRFVFVPVFGNIPANWKLGYSTMRDKLMLQLIGTYTQKAVVPVNVPREICRRGLSLRSLSWTVKGAAASTIAELASKS
uniref:Uncharacterized protein n=1 Tax=Globodera rostochiensis TaxID=31243 RepID=A0A914HP85_GLORO